MAMVEAMGMTIPRWTNAQHDARHESSHVLFLVTRKLSRYQLVLVLIKSGRSLDYNLRPALQNTSINAVLGHRFSTL